MVFRDGGAGTWGWVRVDRTGQPAWALPAETIIAVLPIVMLVANFLRGTIGPTPAGYETLAVAAAVLMVLPAFAILRQSILGLALMFAPIAERTASTVEPMLLPRTSAAAIPQGKQSAFSVASVITIAVIALEE